jgi:hypothetical protein
MVGLVNEVAGPAQASVVTCRIKQTASFEDPVEGIHLGAMPTAVATSC